MTKALVLWVIPLLLGTRFHLSQSQLCDTPCSSTSCSPPYYGTCCHKENIARGSTPTNQSSEFREFSRNFPSSLAVDGNTNNDFSNFTCTHTNNLDGTRGTWNINLEHTYNISEIKLYLRNTQGERYNGLRVNVDFTECFRISKTFTSATSIPPEDEIQHIYCRPPIPGSVVTVSVNHGILTLCEVQIFVCIPGWYGEECDRQCNCRDSVDCDEVTGWCRGGCRAGRQGDGCQCDCDDGHYGFGCSESCGQCLDGDVCDKTNGSCHQGCAQGFQPPLCQDCVDGHYGADCSKSCGRCINGDVCDKTNGTCQQGCVDGFQPPLCQDCDDGRYGNGCSETCGQCLDGNICAKTNGTCPNGCVKGFQHPLCQECEDGRYGTDCVSTCGQCSGDAVCRKNTGHCPDGCDEGFLSPLCADCREYFHLSGEDRCVRCGQCKNNKTCSRETGQCEETCVPGYSMPFCNECEGGLYGPDCVSTCGQCSGDDVCSKTTGHCPGECDEGFLSPLCKDCMPGMYGTDCQSLCGQCADNATCNGDGTCPSGCLAGFTDDLCQTLARNVESPNVATIAGGVSAIIVLIIIIVIVIAVLKRRRSQKKPKISADSKGENTEDTSFINISEPSVTKQVKQPQNHSKSSQKAAPDEAKVSTNGADAHIKGQEANKKRKDSPSGSHRKQEPKESVAETPIHQEPDEIYSDETLEVDPTESPGGGNEYYSVMPVPIGLSKLPQYIKDRLNGVGFDNEYKLLPYGITDDHDEGRKPENKKRNRFLELFPYDHSRVVLKPEVEADWDYINASYISGYGNAKVFIAAQGPNPVTVNDFWRMIWQERVSRVVMLTRLMELMKRKCEQYWPDDKEMKQCGNISVHHEESTVRGDYTIRTFTLKHQEHTSETREVTQLHFTSWPDHDVPSAPALVSFWKQFRSLQQDENTGPDVVHCSAGVGRTGTFIALDSLFEEAEREKKVNVFNCVNQMRKARMNMVQTASQYRFLHEVVLDAVQSRNTLYTCTEFDLKFGTGDTFTEDQKSEIKRQFETLHTMRRKFTDKQVSQARLPENVGKNRDQNILPENRSTPYLTTPVKGRTQYINAVVLPSYTRPSALIATQTPLPDTVVDFWRLVHDHDIVNIVCLEDYQVLYPSKDAPVQSGPFQISLDKERKTRSSFSQTQISLTNLEESEDDRQITVYRPSCSRPSDLVEFVNEMETRSVTKDGQLLVHCNNGADMCGLFCGVLNIITRLRLDREVDIFLDIRELQSIRPSFIHSLDQYRFCFDTVKEYQRSTSIYANI